AGADRKSLPARGAARVLAALQPVPARDGALRAAQGTGPARPDRRPTALAHPDVGAAARGGVLDDRATAPLAVRGLPQHGGVVRGLRGGVAGAGAATG